LIAQHPYEGALLHLDMTPEVVYER
jgi:hypothetical protein